MSKLLLLVLIRRTATSHWEGPGGMGTMPEVTRGGGGGLLKKKKTPDPFKCTTSIPRGDMQRYEKRNGIGIEPLVFQVAKPTNDTLKTFLIRRQQYYTIIFTLLLKIFTYLCFLSEVYWCHMSHYQCSIGIAKYW